MVAKVGGGLESPHEPFLHQLLRETFGRDVGIESYRIVGQRADYHVLLAVLRRPSVEVVIKLAGPDAAFDYPFDRTAMLNRLVAERTSVPVPEILAVDISYAAYPWRYLITRRIHGEEWASIRQRLDPQELTRVYQQLGTAIAQLHMITFPAFGAIGVDETVTGVPDVVIALAARASRMIRQPELRALFLELLDRRRELFADVTTAVLCHDDLHHHNILFHQEQNGWRLATILDFDKAWAGPAESDLARLELWRGMTGHGFWPAYCALHEVAPSYARRRPIYQLLWCLEYAVASPEHHADTQRVCAELGIAPIRFS